MKNSNKKRGFTIVELIIVIAVIAILAAVLIPTFSSLINKSLVAADESLVRNLNEALAMDVTNPHNTMTDALKATKENGFDVSKINARASTDGQKHEILWDSRNDCFVYEKGGEINYIPKSNTKGDATPVELWHIANDGTLSNKYSNYLAAGTYAATLDITTGLDVGEHTEITEVNYSNTNKQKAVIRMNGGKLSVNAPSDDVYFYGYAQEANITEVAGSSFHVVDGIISYAEIAKGHFVVENDSIVNVLYTTAQTAKIDKQGNSIIGKALTTADDAKELKHGGNVSLTLDANGANKDTNKQNSVFRGDGTEESPYLISNAMELGLIRDKINDAVSGSALLTASYKLVNDIDLSAFANWTPIGTNDRAFSGHFNGDNHNVSKMNITSGSYVGLFGYVGSATIENVKLTNANVSGTRVVGGLIGQIKANATVKKCSIDGNSVVVGSNSNTAGLIGEAIDGDNIQLISLINNAKVENTATSNSRAAGILSQVTKGTKGAIVTLKDCINNGAIKTNNGYAGGIVSAYQEGILTITNCVNNGELFGDYTGNMLGWYTSVRSITISSETNEFDLNAIGCFDIEISSKVSLYGKTYFVNKRSEYRGSALSSNKQRFSEIFAPGNIGQSPVVLWDKLIHFYKIAKQTNPAFSDYPEKYFDVFNQVVGFGDGWDQYLSQYNNAYPNAILTQDEFSSSSWRQNVVYLAPTVEEPAE